MTIFFCRSYQIDVDSRMRRYHAALERQNLDYLTLYWDRHLTGVASEKVLPIRIRAVVGGGWASVIGIIAWQFALFWNLIKRRSEVEILHAVDFDCAIPAYIFAKTFKKRLLYDIYDRYTDTRGIKGLAKNIIDRTEDYISSNSDILILPDQCRLAQHRLLSRANVAIIENVPALQEVYQPIVSDGFSSHIRLAYVGVLEKEHRGIENLVEVVSKSGNVILDIAGYGALSKLVEEYSELYSNIRFHGKVDFSVGMRLMRESHLVVGMYHKSIRNNLFAAPNKYYEHLVLGRPLLSSLGTPPGDKVVQYNTGWAIEDDKRSLESFLSALNTRHDQILLKGRNARELWESKFMEYNSSDIFDARYLDMLGLMPKK